MEEFILIRPMGEYASQIAEYRQEFLDAGDSMDGCGPLRRFENPEEYIQVCKDYEGCSYQCKTDCKQGKL